MSPVTPGGVSRRILVADDDPDGAETLAVMLRSNGHEVRVAGDGPGTVAERAAWTALARVLMNLDEFVTKN